MPKRKVKLVKGRGDNEDLDSLENASVISLASDDSEAIVHASTDTDDVAALQSQIERINAASEALTEKRQETRIKALTFLTDAFRKHCLCLDDSWNYSSTFLNGIENVFRKGKPQDQSLAAECLSVFCLQFGAHNMAELLIRFWPFLDTNLRDSSASCIFRASCIVAVSVLQFLAGPCDSISPKDLMKSFEAIFKGSCLKGDGKAPVLEPHVNLLHVTTLKAWGLLFTFIESYDASQVGKAMIPTLVSLLQGNNVDMRIMAGEIAALIYERIRGEADERFKGPHYGELISLLGNLATDGDKSRSKVDRKKQRHSFRDLVDAVAKSDVPEMTVNFGTEVLVLTTCVEQLHYDMLCHLLKGGVSTHLRENCLLRDLFSLGPPVVVSHNPLERRSARDQRRLANSLASKVRTQKLSSHRDRRSNVVNESE